MQHSPASHLARWFFSAFLLVAATAPAAEPHVLRSGWYHWDPYQVESTESGVPVLTGLDVQLLPAIMKNGGRTVNFEQVAWNTHLEDIKSGTRDVAVGAYRTPEREEYAYFSDPYRTETDILVLPRGKSSSYRFDSVPKMLGEFSRLKFRLGVVRGFFYGPEVDAFLKDPANAPLIHYATDDDTNLKRLLKGEIDGFLADRLAAATIAWRSKVLYRVEEHPVKVFSAGIHAMFSKKTCTPETVAAFNEGLKELKASGEYNSIARHYGIPILLGITVHRPWFSILDLTGVVAFAISGVLIARRERYDIFGAFVLAALPAAGGGVLRDLLTGRDPIGLLRSPNYLYAILATVGVGMVFYKITDALRSRETEDPSLPASRKHLPENIYLLFDAIGLAAFTVTGVVIAVEQRCEPLWLWGPLLAALTGAGGGILRDMLRADSNNPSLKGGFYPEVAIIWGLFLAVYLQWESSRLDLREVFLGVIITLLGALGTRLLALRFGIRSPFLYDRRGNSPETLLASIEQQQVQWLQQLQGLFAHRAAQAGVITREAGFNSSRATATTLSDQLTTLSAERLTDTLSHQFITLLQRQNRFTEIQDDLITFLQSDDRLRGSQNHSAVLDPLVESLDAWLKTFLEVLENPTDSVTRSLLAKSLNDRKKTLERWETLAPELKNSPETNHLFLEATAAFERLAANIAAVLALESRRE